MARRRRDLQRKSHSPNRKQFIPSSSSPLLKRQQRKLENKPLAQPLQDSDDSDKLVVKGAGGRHGGYLSKNEQYASGAVGKGDTPGNHPTRAQRRKQMTQAMRDTRNPEVQALSAQHAIPTSSAPTSALRPTTAQPTPSKESSILDGIRPRRRQLSILQAPDLDDSSSGLTDDSFALPDDESTPLHAAKAKVSTATPIVQDLSTSASRKRKLGSCDRVGLSMQKATGELSMVARPTPDPTLPPQPLSALRASAQKQRRQARDDDDIMAPPMSSSSAASPAKVKTPATFKSRKPQQPANLLTEQLQALMPTKRRKTGRDRNGRYAQFDIPTDSDSPNQPKSDVDQDSSFLPTRRKPKRSGPREKGQDQIDTATGMTRIKQKQSKSQPVRTARTKDSKAKAKANTSTRLTLSRSAGNQGTKSPSQQSSTTGTRSLSSEPSGVIGTAVALSGKGKRFGGSPLKTSTHVTEEKENMLGDTIEALVGDSEEERGVTKSPPKKARSKWDEIDAWDMDFEEVEIWERSSEKNAR